MAVGETKVEEGGFGDAGGGEEGVEAGNGEDNGAAEEVVAKAAGRRAFEIRTEGVEGVKKEGKGLNYRLDCGMLMRFLRNACTHPFTIRTPLHGQKILILDCIHHLPLDLIESRNMPIMLYPGKISQKIATIDRGTYHPHQTVIRKRVTVTLTQRSRSSRSHMSKHKRACCLFRQPR